jgi:predicted NUDIX family phosphoesterase
MEFVYVVKRYDLFDLNFPYGFVTGNGDWDGPSREELLHRISEKGFFIERRHAEEDSSFKQIIPYCVVRKNGAVMALRRLTGGEEARLHNKMSIGVGGHINPIDVPEGEFLDAGCERELDEELAIAGNYTKKVVGFINDDGNPVGSVHFGVVFRVDLDGTAAVREVDMLEGTMVPAAELKTMAASDDYNFETWSSLIIERLDDVLNA